MMREFEIERQFGIKIESIKPSKGVYRLKTNQGLRCLKKLDYGVQKLLFVYGAKEHLINNGFPLVDRYYLNLEGEPYALVNEDIYTLSEWIEGRECNFHERDDLIKAAENLAKMHLASKGYTPPENSKLKTDLGRWPYLMEKRIKSLDKMRDMIRKKKNRKGEFDLNYIKTYSVYKELGKRAIKVLQNSNYLEQCKITEEEKSFCHHDYTYHNIIFDNNENVNIIDFDYCKREIRAYDIANFIIKALKRLDWNIEYANLIIQSYNNVNVIKKEEYPLIFAFLLFPQRFWRLSNRYYYNEINWVHNTFNKKIEGLMGEQEKYNTFIDEFKKTYELTE